LVKLRAQVALDRSGVCAGLDERAKVGAARAADDVCKRKRQQRSPTRNGTESKRTRLVRPTRAEALLADRVKLLKAIAAKTQASVRLV